MDAEEKEEIPQGSNKLQNLQSVDLVDSDSNEWKKLRPQLSNADFALFSNILNLLIILKTKICYNILKFFYLIIDKIYYLFINKVFKNKNIS